MHRLLDACDEPLDARVARDIATAMPAGSHLAVASSLPVRALEWCMAPRDGVTVHANRGANGIDGFVSTTLGIAIGTGAPTVGLCGDLCFLHDTNGLLASATGVDATFVVIDNGGGGIFSYLPQHDTSDAGEFEALFATPQHVDLVAVATAHGAGAQRVERARDLPGALAHALATAGVHVIVVRVDPERSVARHRAMFDAVAARLAGEPAAVRGG
jgi:2-succinyl-5-enolpyruvyl-6-hydroxy-3-cyclohexene-1-carboxylate synthase